MAERHGRAFWVKAVAQIERGASSAVAAARLGVNVSTLRWWRSELRRSAPEAVRVLPVEVEPAAAPGTSRVGSALVADRRSAEAMNPRERAFEDPAMPGEASG